MKSSRWFVLSLLVLASIAQAQTVAPAAKIAPQQADVAAPKKSATTKTVEHFNTLHEKFVEQAKAGNIDLLFLGDSITEGWAGGGKEIWKEKYEPLKAANFGISGDRTQHVLWRIENGELENIHPKVCVLMIGTNNIGKTATTSERPVRIAHAIELIIKDVREKTGAKVLLLAIFPRGATQETAAETRAIVAKVNEQIAKLDDGKNVRYLDISEKFLEPDKSISKEIMRDALHPSAKGYQIWADAMDPLLKEMMGN